MQIRMRWRMLMQTWRWPCSCSRRKKTASGSSWLSNSSSSRHLLDEDKGVLSPASKGLGPSQDRRRGRNRRTRSAASCSVEAL